MIPKPKNNKLNKTKNIIWIIAGLLFITFIGILIYIILNIENILRNIINIPTF